ncbi:hypothetical protein G9A89_018384 [Geosiphon pyriformis]|nr:hypothetical protein G9A89_018384 [Geosiphon pyriformis]
MNDAKKCEFNASMAANAIMFLDDFSSVSRFSDLDAICAEESSIKQAINKRMESFELNKDHTIRSVLEHSFCKVILDHLVVDNELVLKPELVKSKVDVIIEEWTRKCKVVTNISEDWTHQYQPLDYVFDGAFSNVMSSIDFNEMFVVVLNLPDGKAADNFSVLKSTSTQSPIFAIGSVIEDALEKNWKLWLVLQDIQAAIQHILNIAGEFFRFNDISINNNKTVTIPINCQVASPHLTISGVPIFIVKKDKPHYYLDIFLSTKSLLKSSLAKAYLDSDGFGIISNSLLSVDAGCLFVYMDGSLNELETLGMKASAAVFFEDVSLGLSVGVFGLVSSIMIELQTIALAFECVLLFHYGDLFSDSQAALDACKTESLLVCSDFRNWCWIKRYHILNVIHCKNLVVNWVKVKDHSSVLGNEHANKLAKNAVFLDWFLPHLIACYEVGSGFWVMVGSLCADIDWYKSFLVWHLDSHLAASFTSMQTADFQMYFIKVLHCQLPVAVCKRLYDKCYPSVVCLFCGDIEVSDHIFSCSFNAAAHIQLLDAHAFAWLVRSGLFCSFLCIVQLLATCAADMKVYSVVLIGLSGWLHVDNA